MTMMMMLHHFRALRASGISDLGIRHLRVHSHAQHKSQNGRRHFNEAHYAHEDDTSRGEEEIEDFPPTDITESERKFAACSFSQ